MGAYTALIDRPPISSRRLRSSAEVGDGWDEEILVESDSLKGLENGDTFVLGVYTAHPGRSVILVEFSLVRR